MWIAYSIPRIEDGNNFGVSIQVNEQFTVFIMVSICIIKLSIHLSIVAGLVV